MTQPLSARAVFDRFLRIPDRTTRALVPLALHAEQARLLDAYDARDPSGAPQHDELACLWIKKAGKSETGGGLVLAELIGGTEPDREVIIVASDLAQSKDVTFASACRFVRRHPWLAEHIRILASELVYRETVVDPRTGGTHTEEHIARAVPARDAKSLHGSRASLTVFDEFHAHSYAVVEALARAPSRAHPRLLYFSYAGLKVDAREGNPLWDLWQRWQRGDDPRLFVSYLGGPDGWRSIPWITDRFIDQQRRQFATVPAKFRRLWLNEWATGDLGSFLTADEIRAAIDPALTEATGPIPEASIGVDLGLTFDTTAIVAAHVDPAQRLIVDACRILRGTRRTPVSLMAVEDLIVALAERLQTRTVTCDRWQAQLLAERLRARGLLVTLTTSDVSALDRWATRLKGWFSTQTIRIPNHPDLIEQLEGLEGEELRRRDRVRFTATGARHDDAAIALCLAAEPHVGRVGHVRMAEQRGCALEECWGHVADCYLFGDGHFYYPPTQQRVCQDCPGHRSTVEAHAAYVARTGDPEMADPRVFVHRGLIEPNTYVTQRRFRRACERWGLL